MKNKTKMMINYLEHIMSIFSKVFNKKPIYKNR